MPTIVFRKIFKEKEYSYANEKGLSFHGKAVTKSMISHINEALASLVVVGGANQGRPVFKWDPSQAHYYARMSHNFQKIHEEDAIAEILDCMEAMGWDFQFQYDSEFSSKKAFGGESETSNELWLFKKEPEKYEVCKTTYDTKVGIVLASTDNKSKIIVQRVVDGGLFQATGIPEGATVMSINGTPCSGKTAGEAIALLTSAIGPIELKTY